MTAPESVDVGKARADEVQLLAQMALDHQAMRSLRQMMATRGRRTPLGACVTLCVRADGSFGYHATFDNRQGWGATVEASIEALCQAVLRDPGP